MKKIIIGILLFLLVALFVVRPIGVRMLDQSMNVVTPHAPYQISPAAAALHETLLVGDWHADTPLWERSIEGPHDYGHVDLARMQQGNLTLQMFTVVTKSPKGQNYESNETSASDNITSLAMAQLWPVKTWSSLTERALYQAGRVQAMAVDNPDDFRVILNQRDLQAWLDARQSKPKLVAGLIGTEGSHALDGQLSNIERLYEAGFRMMSLQHFFDNKLGGSLHGTSGAGLTQFGRDAVAEMVARNIIIDVSHSSEAVVSDVLDMISTPVVVSHTGFKGHCDSPRNINDELMQRIAERGGLIAVGFWDAAACGSDPASVVDAIEYGVALVGEDHVALGSDYDGTITADFDASEIAVLTHTMLERGMDETVIRKVMGENMLRFLQAQLPKS